MRLRSAAAPAAALLCIALLTPSAGCQTGQESARPDRAEAWVVEGTISDDAGPIPGANVWCRTEKATNEVMTDQSGAYTFKGTVAGLIMIGAQKDGYAPATGTAVNALPGMRVGQVDIPLRKEGLFRAVCWTRTVTPCRRSRRSFGQRCSGTASRSSGTAVQRTPTTWANTGSQA